MAELFAPRAVARAIGVNEKYATLLRLFGLREITSGLGIMQGPAGPWLWSRVGGDFMDLAFLGAVMNDEETDPARARAAMAAVVGVTLVDILASIDQTRGHSDPSWKVDRIDRSGLNRAALATSGNLLSTTGDTGSTTESDADADADQTTSTAEAEVQTEPAAPQI